MLPSCELQFLVELGTQLPSVTAGLAQNAGYCTALHYSANTYMLKYLQVRILSKHISKGAGLSGVLGQVELTAGSWLTCVNFLEMGCKPEI